MTDTEPLTDAELAQWRDRIERARRAIPGYRFVAVTPSDLERLFAAVEQVRRERDAAQGQTDE